jgi:hypothetical protein
MFVRFPSRLTIFPAAGSWSVGRGSEVGVRDGPLVGVRVVMLTNYDLDEYR